MSSYTIMRIAPMGHQQIRSIFLDNTPDIASLSYAAIQQRFFAEKYVYSDSFSRCMRKLGQQANEIVYDFDIMQKQWARENRVSYNETTWHRDILLKQIKKMRPDVVFFQGTDYFLHHIKEFKRQCSFVKLWISYTGYLSRESAEYDCLFVGVPLLYDSFKKEGFEPILLYHAFDETILEALNGDAETAKHDFVFLGSSGFGAGAAHYSRYWGLAELIEKTDIQVWISERLDWQEKFEQYRNSFPEGFVPMKPLREAFPDRCQDPLYGLDLYRTLHRSKVTFNIHTEFAAYTNAGNMRMFDITGVGSCLVTDRANNMAQLFEDNKEVVTYSCIDECMEKVGYLLAHENERAAIGAAGQKRTLRDHTTYNRCCAIDEVIQHKL